MKLSLPALFLALGLSTATITPATAYPVDCAILLCLAGGWPASAECVHARAVFIRRITPWPIEPPLQIWNCPMRASFRGEQRPLDRLFDIAFRAEMPSQDLSFLEDSAAPIIVDAQADLDISDPAFDFVRSIRVIQTEYRAYHDMDGHCHRPYGVTIGTYGEQGEFSWSRGDLADIPDGSAFAPGTSCNTYNFRSVSVEWQDYEGTYGFEEVRY